MGCSRCFCVVFELSSLKTHKNAIKKYGQIKKRKEWRVCLPTSFSGYVPNTK
jgi:hypothetical protein